MESTFDRILLTASYTNAALLAILPCLTDFAQRLELPIPLPVTTNHVRKFVPNDDAKYAPSGAITLTNGYWFGFNRGYVGGFGSPHSYTREQDPRRIPRYRGEVNLTEAQAVDLARRAIRRLGYDEEVLYADLEPKIVQPKSRFGDRLARYEIEWTSPRDGGAVVRIEINTTNRLVEDLFLGGTALTRPPPPLSITPVIIPSPDFRREPLGGEVATDHVRRALPEIDGLISRLELPVSFPLTTQAVASVTGHRYEKTGLINSQITLTNGWRFGYSEGRLVDCSSSQSFFTVAQPRVKDHVGTWKLTDQEAVRLARQAVQKVGYPTKLIDLGEEPRIKKPYFIGKPLVPRVSLFWEGVRREYLVGGASVEVDMENGVIVAFGVSAEPKYVPEWSGFSWTTEPK